MKVLDLQALLPPTLYRVDAKTKELTRVPTTYLKGKTVLLYFSAHWCFPCQTFTPQLAGVYQQLKQRGEEVEVVFVSHDNHSGQFELYFKYHAEEGGTWLAVPFKECRDERLTLDSECRVIGIPTLTVVAPDGRIIAPNARAAVAKDPTAAGFPWEGASSMGPNLPIWIVLGMLLLAVLVAKYTGAQ